MERKNRTEEELIEAGYRVTCRTPLKYSKMEGRIISVYELKPRMFDLYYEGTLKRYPFGFEHSESKSENGKNE